jgi:cbb3-type cytochrome oxidase subunit 3
MLVRYYDWDLKSVKVRAYWVFAFTLVFVMGILAILFGGLHALDVLSAKTLDGFWEVAPIVSMSIGIAAGVVYMYRDMRREIDELKNSCDVLSQNHSFFN